MGRSPTGTDTVTEDEANRRHRIAGAVSCPPDDSVVPAANPAPDSESLSGSSACWGAVPCTKRRCPASTP
jgi:hypothetical protein